MGRGADSPSAAPRLVSALGPDRRQQSGGMSGRTLPGKSLALETGGKKSAGTSLDAADTSVCATHL